MLSERPRKRRRLLTSQKKLASVDAAIADLCILRRCVHRIHRFSPGMDGRALLRDGDRCTSLGHWSLISCGRVDPSSVSSHLLDEACRAGRVDAVRALVSLYGLAVNTRSGDGGGWTPLHTATLHDHTDVIECLAALGADDVATGDGVFASALNRHRMRTDGRIGVGDASWRVPREITECTTDLVTMVFNKDMSSDDICNCMCAAEKKWGTNVFRRRDWQPGERRLLVAAAEHGRYSVCRVCVELGAELEIRIGTIALDSPLMLACMNGRLHCAQLLLQCGADPNNFDFSILRAACRNEHRECVRVLLEYGAHVNKETRSEEPPLHIACQWDDVDTARVLLQYGAEINQTSVCHQRTPLQATTFGGRIGCARLLVSHGVDVNTTNYPTQHRTSLHSSSRHGHVELVRLLLENGALVNSTDKDLNTPLHDAAREGHEDCVRLLLEWGAAVNTPSWMGQTPLYCACQCDQFGSPGLRHRGSRAHCARLLLENGAEVDKETDNGMTPLCNACRRGLPECALVLLEYGADPAKRPKEYGASDVLLNPELEEVLDLATRDRAAAMEALRSTAAEMRSKQRSSVCGW